MNRLKTWAGRKARALADRWAPTPPKFIEDTASAALTPEGKTIECELRGCPHRVDPQNAHIIDGLDPQGNHRTYQICDFCYIQFRKP